MARGADLAIEDAANGFRAGAARGADPKDCGDVFIGFEAIALEDVSGVDQDDDLIESLLFDHIEQVGLVLGELEDVIGVAGIAIVVAGVDGLAVGAFGAFTGDDHDGGVMVFVQGRHDSIIVFANRRFADGGVADAVPVVVVAGLALSAGSGIALIESGEFGVQLEASLGQ